VTDHRRTPDTFETSRRRLIAKLGKRDWVDQRVLAAMESVPREEFIDPQYRHLAYDDNALPIAQGQTISQPTVVAMMTSALNISPDDVVLEIGTGSGYQAAIIAQLARHCVSIERHPQLAMRAIETLRRIGIENVDVHVGDGSVGLPELGPYDRILVTAAAPAPPNELLSQLRKRDGSRLVIPVGDLSGQELEAIEWSGGEWVTHRLGSVRFVPLRGTAGWPDTDVDTP
jgi:protein-L-isoaspartate(D-aspartate) O-methyltransferase